MRKGEHEMETTEPANSDLNDIIEQRIEALIREMADADWRTEDVVLAIDAVIQSRWLARLDALRQARDATPTNFVSDGNEG
jgi:hypothetical protein